MSPPACQVGSIFYKMTTLNISYGTIQVKVVTNEFDTMPKNSPFLSSLFPSLSLLYHSSNPAPEITRKCILIGYIRTVTDCSSVIVVSFGLKLVEVTKWHNLFITLHFHLNKLCTKTLNIINSTLFCSINLSYKMLWT